MTTAPKNCSINGYSFVYSSECISTVSLYYNHEIRPDQHTGFNNVVNAFGHSFNSKDSIKGKLLCVFPGQLLNWPGNSGTSLAGSIMSN